MRRSLAWALLLVATAGQAQNVPPESEWKEGAVPAPPATLRLQGLVPLAIPRSSLEWGVDPASVSIGADGVVRYVVVAKGEGGAVTGLHEGLRCDTAQVRVYNRYNAGAWAPATSEWKSLAGNAAARHSLVIWSTAACRSRTPNRSADQIVRELASEAKPAF